MTIEEKGGSKQRSPIYSEDHRKEVYEEDSDESSSGSTVKSHKHKVKKGKAIFKNPSKSPSEGSEYEA